MAEKVFKIVDEFWQCERCEQVYWEGPKYDDAVSRIEGLIAAKDEEKSSDGGEERSEEEED